MTIEEAGEIILGGQPFIGCGPCEGMGYIQLTETTYQDCGPCLGNGRTVRPEYQCACDRLGMDCPDPRHPPIVCDFIVGEEIVLNVIVSEEIVLNVINPAAIKRLTINSKITI